MLEGSNARLPWVINSIAKQQHTRHLLILPDKLTVLDSGSTSIGLNEVDIVTSNPKKQAIPFIFNDNHKTPGCNLQCLDQT